MKESYLLGLLAKIKCSICSYQCENWYLLYGEAIFTSISYSGAQFKRLLCVPLRQSRLGLALLPRVAHPKPFLKMKSLILIYLTMDPQTKTIKIRTINYKDIYPRSPTTRSVTSRRDSFSPSEAPSFS